MNNIKGFTLIELIITIAIGSMVIITAYNILFVGMKGHSNTFKSFENQSDIRYAIETTNNAIKFSTVGFAVTADDFMPAIEDNDIKGLVKPWNYIGLGPDNKSIVHYKYEGSDDKTGHYIMEILAIGSDNLSYDLKFDKPKENQEDKIIKYILEINNNGNKELMATEVEAINALHVINWGDSKKPAIALAYRTEETPEIHRKPVAAISMVLDTSGSMNWNMEGKSTNDVEARRLSLLKNTLTDPNDGLFSIFKESDVYVSLVPFSYNANIPHDNYTKKDIQKIDVSKFYNVKNDKANLETMVNALNADGATNTGDGMRRAYYQLVDFKREKAGKYGLNPNQKLKSYVIVLVDGVTTSGSANIIKKKESSWFYSWWEGRFINFITDSNNLDKDFYRTLNSGSYLLTNHGSNGTSSRNPVGHGSNLDIIYGETYIDKIGQMIQNAKIIDQAFVIGYSNKQEDGKFTELESLTNIATSLGIEVDSNEANEKFKNNDFVFVATDKESLKNAFENIGGYINEELWQIEGPRLNP